MNNVHYAETSLDKIVATNGSSSLLRAYNVFKTMTIKHLSELHKHKSMMREHLHYLPTKCLDPKILVAIVLPSLVTKFVQLKSLHHQCGKR